jgi:hypothetical protein
MYYKEILEVRDDNEKVYFCFYPNSNNQKIIGIPKKNSSNLLICAGKSFDRLSEVTQEEARIMLNSLMRVALHSHPFSDLCNPSSLKLLE